MGVNLETNQSRVRISETKTEAFLSVVPPSGEEQAYAEGDLLKILEHDGVVNGIKSEVLADILKKEDYFTEYLVATGLLPQNGQDGRFEFSFTVVSDKKPKVLPDGSVDYGSMHDVEIVEAGSEIVHYIPAVKGTDGISVMGKIIVAKHGRELPPIKGKGFFLSEDKLTYTAAISGKAEYDEGHLRVSNILVIDSDVSVVTGDITFSGDIVIHGNVVSKMIVNAKGSITVDGHVEGAQLISGKDIVLKNGMQGTGNGEIRAGGSVSGKFFEHTTIYAKGNVNSNALLNCSIMAEEGILVSGKLGVIIGGTVSAIRYIEATTIGNMAEVHTSLNLGVDSEVYSQLSSLKEKVEKETEEINKIEKGIAQINRILEKGGNPELGQKKLQLVRVKIGKDTQLSVLRESIAEINDRIASSGNAKLVVHKSVYRGTRLFINGEVLLMESENYNVTYHKKANEIEFYPNV